MEAGPTPPPSYADRRAPDAGQSLTPAILAGIGAAVVGGVTWTVITGLTGYEVGYVAWALGGLVGFAMSRTTTRRDAIAGGSAAMLALGGLLVARVLIGEFVMGAASYQEVLEDDDLMTQAAVFDMQMTESFPPEIQAAYDAIPEGDTISDALWTDMLTAAETRLEDLPEEERIVLAEQLTGVAIGSLGVTGRVTAQMGMFDLLWAFLAVSTAWGMMKGEEGDAEAQTA